MIDIFKRENLGGLRHPQTLASTRPSIETSPNCNPDLSNQNKSIPENRDIPCLPIDCDKCYQPEDVRSWDDCQKIKRAACGWIWRILAQIALALLGLIGMICYFIECFHRIKKSVDLESDAYPTQLTVFPGGTEVSTFSTMVFCALVPFISFTLLFIGACFLIASLIWVWFTFQLLICLVPVGKYLTFLTPFL